METNYARGRRREYKAMNLLRRKGCDVVFRSAGSHSPIDVVGIDRTLRKIIFLQCKPESTTEKQRDKLLSGLVWLSDEYQVEFYVF